LAGIGAAAVVMTAIASVRDRYVGDEMAKIMSFVFSLFLIIPVIAPALGSWILQISTWRVVFLIPPYFAIIVFIWTFRIRESHPEEKRTKVSFIKTLPELKKIFSNKIFMKYTIIATLLFSILSSWVASSERIIGEIFHRADLFPIIFGLTGLLMAIFAFFNSYLSKKIGAKRSLKLFLTSYFFVALLLTIITILNNLQPPLIIFFVLVAFLMAFTTAGDPNSSALALEQMGEKAGLAASIYGTIFFFFGSGIGTVISNLMTTTVLPLTGGAMVLSAIALTLFYSLNKNIQKTN
jgi:DHA1 family bicyclomycin/chloramphenicol resistance-like MFS transporter